MPTRAVKRRTVRLLVLGETGVGKRCDGGACVIYACACSSAVGTLLS